jgi:hypothetical protein
VHFLACTVEVPAAVATRRKATGRAAAHSLKSASARPRRADSDTLSGRFLTMRHPLLASICLALALTPGAGSTASGMQAIRGTLTVAPGLAHHIGPNDRLVIKLYHPKDGVEMDAKYEVVPGFSLPFAFRAAPSIDMNARTKYDAYVVELFTDKDNDVLAIAPGELIVRTPAPVPLGTQDLQLELNATRE